GDVDEVEGGIQIYEFGTGKLVRKIETQETPIAALAFSPDGQTLASIGCRPLRGGIERGGLGAPKPMGGYFRPRDVGNGEMVLSGVNVLDNQPTERIALTPDGRTIALGPSVRESATGGERIKLKGREPKGRGGQVYAVAFSPDGRTLALGNLDGTVSLWDPL